MKKGIILAGSVLCLLLAGCAGETVTATEADSTAEVAETTVMAETTTVAETITAAETTTAEATMENAESIAETTAAVETSEVEISAEPQNPYRDLAGIVNGTVELTWANGTTVDGIYLTEPEDGRWNV